MTGLPDLQHASDRELVRQWRDRAAELDVLARILRRNDDESGAEITETAARHYREDASRLEREAA